MCTSFAVYFDQPMYGMNFDFADVELKWRMASDEGRQAYRSVFYLCFELDGAFTEVAGVNDRGLFGAGQILVADFEIVPHSQDVLVSPYQVFVGALRKGCRVDDVLDLIGDRRLAYTSDAKGHQLYADRFGSAIVVEPGRAGNEIGRSEVGFVVMTNFAIGCFDPHWQARGQEAAEWSGLGADRYRTACQFIAGHRGHLHRGGNGGAETHCALGGSVYDPVFPVV
jgi:hypothetical protein